MKKKFLSINLFLQIVCSLSILTFAGEAYSQCQTSSFCASAKDKSLPQQRTGPMIWGINGHPMSPAYSQSNLDFSADYTFAQQKALLKPIWLKQLNYMKDLGTTHYRHNVTILSARDMCADRTSCVGDIGDIPWVNNFDSRNKKKGNEVFKAFCNYTQNPDSNEAHYRLENIIVLDHVSVDLTQSFGSTLATDYNYLLGKEQAKAFMDNIVLSLPVSSRPKYFELTNEITGPLYPGVSEYIYKDINLARYNASKGIIYADSKDHFNLNNCYKLFRYIKGLQDGLKSNDWAKSNVKILFGSDAYSYGILEAIGEYNAAYPAESFNYDILSWHWYSFLDNNRGTTNKYSIGSINATKVRTSESTYSTQNTLAKIIAASNYKAPAGSVTKDLWITEFGHMDFENLYQNLDEFYATKKVTVNNMLDSMYKQPEIKALFYYELYNSVTATEASDPNKRTDIHGLLKWNDDQYHQESKSPEFDAFQNHVQYLKNGYEDYIYSLYIDVNGRYPDQGGLDYWTQRLKCSQQTCGITKELMNAEFLVRYVNDQYSNIMGRTLNTSNAQDLNTLSGFVNQLSVDNPSFENFKVQLFTSTAFQAYSTNLYTSATSANEAFLLNVDRILHNRIYTSTSRLASNDYWLVNLNNGTYTKTDVIFRKLKSQEYISGLIDEGFRLILKRPNTPVSTSDYWYQQLINGSVNEAGFLFSLLFSPEYRERSMAIGVQRRLNNCGQTGCNAYAYLNFCNFNPQTSCPASNANYSVLSAPVMYTKLAYKFTNATTGVGTMQLREGEENVFNLSASESSEVKIAPNPFSEKIVVSLSERKPVEINLYNQLGVKQVVSENVESEGREIVLNTNSLAPGLYIIQIISENEINTVSVIKY